MSNTYTHRRRTNVAKRDYADTCPACGQHWTAPALSALYKKSRLHLHTCAKYTSWAKNDGYRSSQKGLA